MSREWGQVTTSQGNFHYTYDKLNRLTKITNHKNEIFDFSYDQAGRISQQRSPASITAFDYNSSNFLVEFSNSKRSNSNLISKSTFERDEIGNIAKITTLKGETTFAYDNNNQLVNSNSTEILASNFVYDSLGNRISDQDGTYLYDSKKQRLQEDWRFNYTYDLNGNLISKISKNNQAKLSYEYNSQNQLTSFKEISGNSITKETRYYYDALGRRVAKEHTNYLDNSKSFVRQFSYDGQDIIFDFNDDELQTVYTHSKRKIDDVLSMDRNNISYFYLKDHLGTVTEIVDSAGLIIQRYVYSPFGSLIRLENSNSQTLTSPVIENMFAFTGREYDSESELYYYRARYYDPAIGRFISSDPHPGILKHPISFVNKYIYALNSPAQYRDPSGKIIPFLVVIAVSAVIGGAISSANGGNFWTGALIGALSATAVMGGALGMMALTGTLAGGAGGFAAGALGGAIAGSLTGDLLHAIGLKNNSPTGRERFVGGLFGALGGGMMGVNGVQSLTQSSSIAQEAGGTIHDINTGVAEGFMPEDRPITNVEINLDFGPVGNQLMNDLMNITNQTGKSIQIPLY